MSSPYQESLLHFNMRDEVKKLSLIIQAPLGQIKSEDQIFVARTYVLEKLVSMLTEMPIALDAEKQGQFNRWKRGLERLQ